MELKRLKDLIMEDLIELYKRRDALAKENTDASDITNIINGKGIYIYILIKKVF